MVDLTVVFAQNDPLGALAEQAGLSPHELLEKLGFGVVPPKVHAITRRTRYSDILRGMIGYHKLIGKPKDGYDKYDEYLATLEYALFLVERELETQQEPESNL